MASAAPALRIRALTLMDVLDESFRIYRANFPVLAGLAILLAIPLLAVTLLSGTTDVLSSYYTTLISGNSPTGALTTGNPWISLLQYPVQLLLLPFQTATLYAAAVAIVLGRPVTILAALQTVFRRYWALWVLSFVYGIAYLAICCPPLGVWLLTKLSILFPAVFTEEAPIGTAFQRSWRLTDGAFWRVFAVLLLAWLLARTLETALAAVFIVGAGIFPDLPLQVRVLLIVAVSSLMVQVVQPLSTIAVTLLYFDLRVRREAFDLEVMAYQLSLPEGGDELKRALLLPLLPLAALVAVLLQPVSAAADPQSYALAVEQAHSLVKEGLSGRSDAAPKALAILLPEVGGGQPEIIADPAPGAARLRRRRQAAGRPRGDPRPARQRGGPDPCQGRAAPHPGAVPLRRPARQRLALEPVLELVRRPALPFPGLPPAGRAAELVLAHPAGRGRPPRGRRLASHPAHRLDEGGTCPGDG